MANFIPVARALAAPLLPNFYVGCAHRQSLFVANFSVGCAHRQSVFVDRSRMTQEEVSGQNGVVHVLDDLLIPDRGQLQFQLYGDDYQLASDLNHFDFMPK